MVRSRLHRPAHRAAHHQERQRSHRHPPDRKTDRDHATTPSALVGAARHRIKRNGPVDPEPFQLCRCAKAKVLLSRTDHNPKLRPVARPATIRVDLIGSNQCNALSIVAHGYTPVLGLCRRLIDTGINPATALHVYRGDTLCLIVRSVGQGARLEINGDGTGFRPRRQPDAASPMRLNGRGQQ